VSRVFSAPQVKLLLAAVDQLAADGLAMSARLRERAGGAGATTGDVVRAAGQAAGAAAAQFAFEQGLEAGSAPAAASKAATVLLGAAGVVAPGAQLQELPADTAAAAHAAGQAGPSSWQPQADTQQQRQQQQQQQQQQGSLQQRRQQSEEAEAQSKSAKAASRVAAELSSMQILVGLPYAEVICFADVGDSSCAGVAGSAAGHRWVLRASWQLLPMLSACSLSAYSGWVLCLL
jgi:type IV secretory pathway VirB10-like protein